jgi:hypothetical protein
MALPLEMRDEIFSYLSPKDLKAVRGVSKALKPEATRLRVRIRSKVELNKAMETFGQVGGLHKITLVGDEFDNGDLRRIAKEHPSLRSLSLEYMSVDTDSFKILNGLPVRELELKGTNVSSKPLRACLKISFLRSKISRNF